MLHQYGDSEKSAIFVYQVASMMKRTLFLSLAVFTALFSASAETIDELLPVRGLAIEAPKPDGMTMRPIPNCGTRTR